MFSLFVHRVCGILVMSSQLLGLNRWSSFTVYYSGNIWKGHSAHWLNTSDLGRGPSKQLLPVRRSRESEGPVEHLLVEVRIFQQLSLGLFTSCVFGEVFFPLISNKAEMNVCGNWRGSANSSAVPCHSQSRPCVSSSWRVTCLISRQSRDARETSLTESFLLFSCLKGSGGFILMLGVTGLFAFGHVQ